MGDEKQHGIRRGFRRLARRVTDRLRVESVPKEKVSITFQGHRTVEVPSGTTLLLAARLHDLDISHYCGGFGSCGTCRVEVLEGEDQLSSMAGREQMVLGNSNANAGFRLACQVHANGPVTVRIPDWF